MCRTLFSQHILFLIFSSYNLSLLKMWNLIQTKGEILGAWIQNSCKEHFFLSTYCYLIFQITICHCLKCGTLFKPNEYVYNMWDFAQTKGKVLDAWRQSPSNQRRSSGSMDTEFIKQLWNKCLTSWSLLSKLQKSLLISESIFYF